MDIISRYTFTLIIILCISGVFSFGNRDKDPPLEEQIDYKGDVYLREEFMSMDNDSSGAISTDDFCKLLLYLGVPSKERIKVFLSEIQPDSNSTITINEYYQLMQAHPEVKTQTSEWRNIFRAFDPDENGKANKKVILNWLKSEEVDNDDLIYIIDKLDLNGDDQVLYQDFIRVQLEKKSIKCE